MEESDMPNKKIRLSDEDNTGVLNPEGSVRISKSCDVCRVKKLKCNSLEICGYCKKNNLGCVYSVVKKPGLKPGYGRDVTKRLDYLEEQNAKFIEQLKTLNQKVDVLLSGKGKENGNFNDNNIISVPNLLNHSEPRVAFSNNVSVMSQIRSEPHPSSQKFRTSTAGAFGENLPSIEVVKIIIDVFFARVFPVFPVIHPYYIEKKVALYLKNLETSTTNTTIKPPLIIFGIILNSVRFLSPEKPPFLLQEELDSLHQYCKEQIILNCYSVSTFQQLQTITLLAFDTFGNSNGTESWSLIGISASGAIHLNLSNINQSISSLPLTYKHDSPSSAFSDISGYSGSVNAVEKAKSFTTRPANLLKKPQNWLEEESRRRLLWGIYILDTLSAIISGLPSKLPILEIRFPPPFKTEMWINVSGISDAQMNELEMAKKNDLTYFDAFSYYSELNTIFAEIHAFLRTPLDLNNKIDVGNWFIEFHRLENRVYFWKDELAGEYQSLLNSNILVVKDKKDISSYAYAVLLHALYNVTLVKHNSAYGYPHAESASFEHSRHSRRVCHQSVDNVIHLSTTLLKWENETGKNIFEFLGPHYAFYIWVCSRLLIAGYIFSIKDNIPTDREKLNHHLKIFAEILHKIGKFWCVSEKYYNILKKLITLDIQVDSNKDSPVDEIKEDQDSIAPTSALADMRINTHLLSLILTKKFESINPAGEGLSRAPSSTSLGEYEKKLKSIDPKQEDHQLLEAFKLDASSYGFEDFLKYLDYNNFSSL